MEKLLARVYKNGDMDIIGEVIEYIASDVEGEWVNVDRVWFDKNGNLYIPEITESDNGTVHLRITSELVIKGEIRENAIIQ